MDLLEEIIIDSEDSSDSEHHESDFNEGSRNLSSHSNNVFVLAVAFFLMFRVIYNIPDHAVVLLLHFFKYLLSTVGGVFQISELETAEKFPQSIQGCYSFLNLEKKPYKEYIVCPSCHMLFNINTLSTTTRRLETIKCSFVEFPNHPQMRFRLPCNTTLFNQVQKKRGREYKPRRIYYYYGLKAALNILLSNSNFMEFCNLSNRLRSQNQSTTMSDIMDGEIWQCITAHLSPNSRSSSVNILGILINVDWFQPFKHVSYSVGVIYAVIINLPRSIRYKSENVIIIGIIPGPNEPKQHINSYLGPLVSELLELQNGQWYETSVGRQFIKCAMVGLASDIPATRKAAGFVGHNAIKGCSRCLKSFPKVVDHTDYAGFDREKWTLRTHAEHTERARRAVMANTLAERKAVEKEYGAKYSVFFELPYYDSVRFATIDIMHNVFLGTAKHVMAIWKENNILSKDQFAIMQHRIEKINVPIDVGRIPHKIESAMSGLTADQWKNWTCIYSLFVLHDLLPKEHLECWWLFVQACILICQPTITKDIIKKIDEYFLSFCQTFQNLYGTASCTINLHLHCHLAECLRDYGPAHDTWCFSFERLNGVLGRMPSNKQLLQIEKTLITRFVQQIESWRSFPQFTRELEQFFHLKKLVPSVKAALTQIFM